MGYWQNREKEEADLESGMAEVQGLLREAYRDRKEPNPFFSKRVMAAIEAREAELTRRARGR